MSRLLLLTIAAAVAGCSPVEREAPSGQAARTDALRTSLEEISADFHARRPALSAYSSPCDATGDGRLLDRYFDALLTGDSATARQAVAQLFDALDCYDSADFEATMESFAEAALLDRGESDHRARQDLNQAIVPIAFLFLESRRSAPSEQYLRYSSWFADHAQSISLGLSAEDRLFEPVGFVTHRDDTLVQLPAADSVLLLDLLRSGDVPLLRCAVEDMMALEEDDEVRLVCPGDCVAFDEFLGELTPEERAALRAALPEYAALCDDIASALDESDRVRPGVLGCVQDYVNETRSGVACVAENLKGLRGSEPLFERVRSLGEAPTLEVIRNSRFCQVADMTPEEREEYEELTEERRELAEEIEDIERQIKQNNNDIRRHKRTEANQGAFAVCVDWASPLPGQLCDRVIQRLENENTELRNDRQERIDRLRETYPRWSELNREFKQSRVRNCPPGMDNCGEGCGLDSALSDSLTTCLFEETEELPDPDAPVTRPDPRDPPVPEDTAVANLMQCIATVIAENRPEGQQHCSATVRCPDRTALDAVDLDDPGGVPPGVSCTCLEEITSSDARNNRLCRWIAMPDPRTPGAFTCPEPGEDRGGEGSGIRVGPDPEVFLEVRIAPAQVQPPR